MGAKAKPLKPLAGDELPHTIYWGVDEKRMNDEVIRALAGAGDIYQRGPTLVRIERRMKAKQLTPAIGEIPAPSLREKISEVTRFRKNHKEEPVPEACVAGVRSRSEWELIPHLTYAVEHPVLRPDGTVLQQPGYDEATKIFYMPTCRFSPVPDEPKWDDVVAARERLLDLVCDFPFAQPAHRSAWMAGLLTPFARPAYEGATPCFLIDANVRSAGKTKACHVAARIATGRDMPTTTQPSDEAETGKLITAVARSGEVVKLIDNITRPFGNGKFDAALTSTWWEDRVLGVNDMFSGPLYCIWWATGNNVQFFAKADTARRVLHVRLLSPEQNPEKRTDFKYKNLLGHVLQHRGQLAADCLMLLRAFRLHGLPEGTALKPYASFEAWSELVRGTIVYCGLPDPIDAQEELAKLADTSANSLRDLVVGWRELCNENRVESCSVREAHDWLAEDLEYKQRNHGHHLRFTALLDALSAQCVTHGRALPDVREIAAVLRSFRGRVVDSEYLETDSRSKQGQRWMVKRHG